MIHLMMIYRFEMQKMRKSKYNFDKIEVGHFRIYKANALDRQKMQSAISQRHKKGLGRWSISWIGDAKKKVKVTRVN